jgi:large subunit ribosomal protein L30
VTGVTGLLKITLKRSICGRGRDQIRTARSLGLSRINKTVTHRDTPQIRGMIRRIAHLVSVEEARPEGDKA